MNGKIKSLLNLHKPEEGKDYLIGIFMTGAYQEALGNLHNLFGSYKRCSYRHKSK